MTIILGVNMKTRQMITFFSAILLALSVSMFHFCLSRPSNFNSMKVAPLHYLLLCNTHSCMTKMTFSNLLTKILFFYVKSAIFWNITCFALIWNQFEPAWAISISCATSAPALKIALFRKNEPPQKIRYWFLI